MHTKFRPPVHPSVPPAPQPQKQKCIALGSLRVRGIKCRANMICPTPVTAGDDASVDALARSTHAHSLAWMSSPPTTLVQVPGVTGDRAQHVANNARRLPKVLMRVRVCERSPVQRTSLTRTNTYTPDKRVRLSARHTCQPDTYRQPSGFQPVA